jgi:uroporphyrinogen decarboxylase
MAELEVAFYERYKPDLLKVMHDIDFEPISPIVDVEDWAKLKVLDPQVGNFGKQLHTLRQIRASLDPDVPMIDTVFGVYHYADLLSEGRLLTHLRQDRKTVHAGLAVLTDTLAAYAEAVVDAGCDGIYYAVTGAHAGGATRQEYLEQFLGYDRLVLHAASDGPLNVVHLHGYNELYFDMAHSLPGAILCWSDAAGGPSIEEARAIHRGCIMAGIDEVEFVNLTAAQITAQGRAAIKSAATSRFILGPGCAIPTDSDPALIDAIRAAVV